MLINEGLFIGLDGTTLVTGLRAKAGLTKRLSTAHSTLRVRSAIRLLEAAERPELAA
jgi:hypothetical protein